jgi:hypothetical protein
MGCCQLVGDLTVTGGCYISINTSCTTEAKLVCGESKPLAGSTIQTVTVTGYASENIHMGCSGRAGVSTTLTRKYDCSIDSLRFFCGDYGSSYVAGDVEGLASVIKSAVSTPTLSASSASGPASIYLEDTQINGLGLKYTGNPMSFTTSEDSCTMLNINIASISGDFYLQSFSLDVPSGQLPVASYTLTRVYQN